MPRQQAMRKTLPVVALIAVLSGCATLLSSATGRMADNLAGAVADQDDPATVRDGAPAFLLMLDGLIAGDPRNVDLLLTGAQLYSAYASAFVEDSSRSRRLTSSARGYARRALCLRLEELCHSLEGPEELFMASLRKVSLNQVPVLYRFAATWASWLQNHTDDWNALAQVPRLEAVMERLVALDETYDHGNAHLYLAVLGSRLPPALGGRPEDARRHFERAIGISAGRNLMAQVLYAKHYARLVFDRSLHDRLLQEVVAADPHEPGLTLSNVIAQDWARGLLSQADDYF